MGESAGLDKLRKSLTYNEGGFTPYANGGHVALRRKMFKLGGDVNTHGIGITSGLSYNNNYNAGGAVRQGYKKGKLVFDAGKKLWKWIKGKPSGKPGKPVTTTGTGAAGPWATTRTGPRAFTKWDKARQIGRGATAATGILGTPGAVSALFGDRLGDYASTEEDWKGSGTERALKALRHASEFGLDWSLPGGLFEVQDYLTRDPSEVGGYGGLSDFLAGRERGPASGQDIMDQSGEDFKSSITPSERAAQIADLKKQRLEEAMDMYKELLSRADDGSKWRDVGDALIAGGSSLMEGEGWGPSAEAFNEPLSVARARAEEQEDAYSQMAASQAISDMSAEEQIQQQILAEQLGAGDYSMAEATKKYAYASSMGVDKIVPTDEDGEVDTNALKKLAGEVLSDPKNSTGTGAYFIAVNNQGMIAPFDYIEEAEKYAAK